MPPKRSSDFWTATVFIARFVEKVEFGEHWLWIAKARMGTYNEYPAMQWRGEKKAAHRLSYSFFNCGGRKPPSNLDVHHDCRIKLCVHPDHLSLVTVRQHRVMERSEYCKWGHKRTKENTRDDGSCQDCKRLRAREYYRRKHGL